jgi:hypothetical protein
MFSSISGILMGRESIRVRLIRALIRRWPRVSLEAKIRWDIFSRPNYAYGTYRAAMEAAQLGIKQISVIEFGVAGGNGLSSLEDIASEITRELGIAIDVYGFDTGQGMPPPLDFRDLPHVWQEGFFRMDAEALKSRLKRAKLIIGNVAETVQSFLTRTDIAPIGFISFDLDYYSSTVQAFKLLEGNQSFFLPRVYSYFDDIVGDDWEHHSKYAGVLLAIKEFNAGHETRKVAPINSLRHKRKIQAAWNEQMYLFHDFQHPHYTKHILPNKNWHLPLTPKVS